MGLSLVAKQACVGRKPGVLTFGSLDELAPVGPEMGIHVFTAPGRGWVRRGFGLVRCDANLLVDTFLSGGRVVALEFLEHGATVLSILVRSGFIERVTSGLGLVGGVVFFGAPGLGGGNTVVTGRVTPFRRRSNGPRLSRASPRRATGRSG